MSEPGPGASLRLAVVVPTFPELTNTFVLNQVTGLLDRGHDVSLFALSRRSFADAHEDVRRFGLAERMRHLEVPRPRGRRLATAIQLAATPEGRHRAALDALLPHGDGWAALTLVPYFTAVSLLRGGRFDVVHAQFGELGPRLARWVRLAAPETALVTSFRGADLTKRVPRAPRSFAELFRHGDLFLPVCAAFRSRLIEFGAAAERVVVHRSGIDLARFTYEPVALRDDAVPRVLFVGRLTAKKGVGYLLEAVARVRAAGRPLELDVIGTGGQHEALRRRAGELGLGDAVRFHGARPHAAVLLAMRRAHLLAAPSVTADDGDQEGIPNVLKEAMAMGLPVVATRHSGIPELVDHGVSGFLAAERDVEGLSGCLLQAIDAAERWPAMGRAGRRRIEEAYDATRLADELVGLYRRAIAVRGHRAGAAT